MWDFVGNFIYATPPRAIDDEDPALMVKLCEKIVVIEKRINLLSGDEKLVVKLYLSYAEKEFELAREEISEKTIFKKYTSYGGSILESPESAIILKQAIVKTEKKSPITYSHGELGFQTFQDGRACFLGYHPIGIQLSEHEAKSVHENEKMMKPRGSLNTWRSFFRKKIAKNAKLSMALLLGVSAPVAHILRVNDVFSDIPLWAVIGETSSGKTTVLQMMASMYANPRRFIATFNATTNAFFASIREKQGYPALIDEATHAPHFDWDAILYGIPDGREKMRCDGAGKLRDLKDFSGAVVITSEKSILERSQGYGGQNARILEFCENWFDGRGEDAEEVKLFCANHYGWATEPLISLLLEDGFHKKLGKRWRKIYRALIFETSATAGVEYRLLQRLALLLVSGWVFEKALKIDLHLKEVKKLLLKTFYESRQRYITVEPADELLNHITDFIIRHQEYFPSEAQVRSKSRRYTASSLYGVRGEGCVWILDSIFRRIMNQQARHGFRTACKKLESAQYLKKYYHDRYIKEEAFGVVQANFYCVLLPESNSEIRKIDELKKYDKTLEQVNKVFNEDYYALEDYSWLKKFGYNDNKKMTLGFLRLSAQTFRLVMNVALKDALDLTASDRLYFIPILVKGILIISKNRLIKNAPSCTVSLTPDKKRIFADSRKIELIVKLFGENIEAYNRLLLTDISIESKGDITIAVINMKNDYGRWLGKLCSHDPLSIDDIYNVNQGSNLDKLLAPDEDEE